MACGVGLVVSRLSSVLRGRGFVSCFLLQEIPSLLKFVGYQRTIQKRMKKNYPSYEQQVRLNQYRLTKFQKSQGLLGTPGRRPRDHQQPASGAEDRSGFSEHFAADGCQHFDRPDCQRGKE